MTRNTDADVETIGVRCTTDDCGWHFEAVVADPPFPLEHLFDGNEPPSTCPKPDCVAATERYEPER